VLDHIQVVHSSMSSTRPAPGYSRSSALQMVADSITYGHSSVEGMAYFVDHL
jgi:hypothetical protein